MKLFINRAPIRDRPWGGGVQMVNALFDHLPAFDITPTNTLDNSVDAIMMIDPRYDELGISAREIINFTKAHPHVKLFHRVNECDARKGTFSPHPEAIDGLLVGCSFHSTKTIFVSEWLREHFRDRWQRSDTHVIHNGVNHDWFKPGQKFNNGKINIVAHHWSSHKMKGVDVYGWLDDFVEYNSKDFTFTYIGRTEINFLYSRIIPPLFGRALGEELGKYDLYITGTQNDPAPNHCIEALSCRLPVYARAGGGGANEFSGEQNTFQNFDDLVTILRSKDYKQNVYQPKDWKTCVAEYAKLIKS